MFRGQLFHHKELLLALLFSFANQTPVAGLGRRVLANDLLLVLIDSALLALFVLKWSNGAELGGAGGSTLTLVGGVLQ